MALPSIKIFALKKESRSINFFLSILFTTNTNKHIGAKGLAQRTGILTPG